jgi:hypothetical protein
MFRRRNEETSRTATESSGREDPSGADILPVIGDNPIVGIGEDTLASVL